MRSSIRGWLFSAICIVLVGTSGCYLSHEGDAARDGGARARDTGGTPGRDAGPRPDTGAPPTIDASLPPLDEPDPRPDERPSDDPSADDWRDPPATSGACCDIGEVIGLDDPTHQASGPVLAWGDGRWGVAWADIVDAVGDGLPDHAVFVELDTDARPAAPRSAIEGVGFPTALAYVPGRYAIGVERPGWPPERPSYLGLLDVRGNMVDVAVVPEQVASVARFPAAHAWMVAAVNDDGEPTSELSLRAYDDALDEIGDAIDLGEGRGGLRMVLVAVKTRLVALRAVTDGVAQTTFAGRDLERISEGLLIRPSSYLDEQGDAYVGAAVAATRMRNTVVAVTMDQTALRSVVLDPFAGTISETPAPIATSPAYQGHDVAADEVGGTLGVCYPDGEGPYGGYVETRIVEGHELRVGAPNADSIRFVLLGPDGSAIGAPVTIAAGLTYVAACAVAAAGPDEYVVVFWNASRAEPRHSILAARVSVRR